MKAVTWQKDSHGLFDYETQLLTVKKYRIAEDSSVYRQDQEINIFGVQAPAEANQQFLTTVLQDSENSNFYIQPDQSRNESADNYLIVRSLKNSQGVQKGYKLEPGDVIKLGRMEYSIIEMRDQQGVVRTPYNEDFNKEVEHGPIAHDSSATCRICLNEGQTEENPFITPCKCRGTCEFVHFNCLKYWIDSRAQQKQQNGATTYKWKKLDCEICETPYPPKVKVNDHSFHLAEIVRPETPYLIMQSSVKDKKASKGVFVIQCPEVEAVKLGRGHQCDIRISDISVSRLHALIKYEDGNFVIVDNNSKFGTLVKMMKPFQIIQDKVAIQVGRTVLTFVMKQDRQEKVK